MEAKVHQPGYTFTELSDAFRQRCDAEICGNFASDRARASVFSRALDQGNQVLRQAENQIGSTTARGVAARQAGSEGVFWQQALDVSQLLKLHVHSPNCVPLEESRGGKRASLHALGSHADGGSKRARTGSSSRTTKSKGKATAGSVYPAPELSESLQSSAAYLLEVLAASQFAGGQVRVQTVDTRESWEVEILLQQFFQVQRAVILCTCG